MNSPRYARMLYHADSAGCGNFSIRAACGLAVAGCLAELLAGAFSTHGFFQNRGLSVFQTAMLCGLHALSWLTIAVVIRAALRCGERIRHSGWRAALARSAIAACLALAAWFYLFAWIFQFRTGLFPGRDTLQFATVNARQLARYFSQYEARNVALLVLGCAGLGFIAILVVRKRARLNATGRSRDVSLYAALIACLLWMNAVWACGVFAARDLRQSKAAAGSASLLTDPWPKAFFEFRFHVNPLVTLASDLFLVESDAFQGEIPAAALTPRLSHPTADPPVHSTVIHRSVVLITVESLRADVIGLEHQGQPVMPCLSGLARHGAFFPNCYSQSTHSDYSDPAIMSSLYPLRSQYAYVYQSGSPWSAVRIYDLLSPAGYATAIFSSQNEAWSNMHLFYESPHLDLLFDSRTAGENSYSFGELREWAELTGLAGKLDDAATADAAMKWIGSLQVHRRPFFLSLNFQTSHFPYRRPDGRTGPFVPAGVPEESSPLAHDGRTSERIRNAYFNALHYIDAQVQRIVEACSRSDPVHHPLFVITGDHGEAFGENGVAGHGGAPLDMTTRVGLVISCPGRIRPCVDEYLAQSIDIGPTVLGTLGFGPCPAFQGIDLLSPSRPKATRRLVFIHCKTAIVGTDCVLTGNGWRYSWDRLREVRHLCYRPSDRGPEAELSAEFPQVTAALHAILDEWRRRQLLYYAHQQYYGLFYPPRAPELDDTTSALLIAHP